jgi:hypothetical protein
MTGASRHITTSSRKTARHSLLHPDEIHIEAPLLHRLKINAFELVQLRIVGQRVRAAGVIRSAQLDEDFSGRAGNHCREMVPGLRSINQTAMHGRFWLCIPHYTILNVSSFCLTMNFAEPRDKRFTYRM